MGIETEDVRCQPSSGGPGDLEIMEPRMVPLGGPRAMTVRRTIPSRRMSLVGPWCFVDHFGPDDVGASGGMNVPPHPHMGLQTVTWLFEGAVEHRDSLGSLQQVKPGQLNVMTAGSGLCHSEVSDPRTPRLHGVQLWVALRDADRNQPPAFEHHEDLPAISLALGRVQVQVLVGTMAGMTSPATVFSPLVGAQVDVEAGTHFELPLEPGFEHGILLDQGAIHLDGEELPPNALATYLPGRSSVTVEVASAGPARLMLIGGEPFGEEIVMWWNLIARTHEEIATAQESWQSGLGDRWRSGGSERFGVVAGYSGDPLPAPEMPRVKLRSRAGRRPITTQT